MAASLTRRSLLLTSCAMAACRREAQSQGWPAAWDRILLEKAAATEAQRYNEKESLVTRLLQPGFAPYTKLHDMRAHDLRASLDYVLMLLELGGEQRLRRAALTLARVLLLQETNAQSEWCGLWSYYKEEPLAQMAVVDATRAETMGATLALIALRHAPKLAPELASNTREALRLAAAAVQRRDEGPALTSICIKGVFVCAAAGEALGDASLGRYAQQRLARLEEHTNSTGSFDEYNSPVAAKSALSDLTRVRTLLKPGAIRDSAARLEHRLWTHLAHHWDGYRKQFAAPMSRAFDSDLGEPFWLEKALNVRLGLANAATRPGYGDAETALCAYACPEDVASQFLTARDGLRSEIYTADGVRGTTYVQRGFSLGSVSHGDMSSLRRPLLIHFGDATRPARVARLRVIRDGYDFASAMLTSVQRDGCVLGLLNFRYDGGGRHPTLDPIRNGTFACGRLFLEFSVDGLEPGFAVEADLHTATVRSQLVQLAFHLVDGRFGTERLTLRSVPTARGVTLTADFKPAGKKAETRWRDVGEAWAVFALQVGTGGTLAGAEAPAVGQTGRRVEAQWSSPAGPLSLSGPVRIEPGDGIGATL